MNRYDGIVAYDVSRLSREYFDLAWLRKWAEENHKKLYVIKERLHWPDNRDGTLWGVAAERAFEERQDIIERVTRELTALRDAGKLAGAFPFGYTSAGDKYDAAVWKHANEARPKFRPRPSASSSSCGSCPPGTWTGRKRTANGPGCEPSKVRSPTPR